MLRRIAERSLAIIVHNPAAAAMVRRHAPGAMVVEMPHLFDPPALPPVFEAADLRERLGVPQTSFLFGVFGHLRESKRLASVFRAFERVPDCRLLIAGEFASGDLERAVASELRHPRIARAGYLPERDFWLHAAAVDACINLRYPAAGESSGIAVRLMGIGKCVLMSDGPEVSGFPEDSCLRVDSGPAEIELLAHYMAWLSHDPGKARAIGRRARAHILEHHPLDKVAAVVLETARAVEGR
jgi:glycosyltransferase involved in cell wall biosynthesis